MAGYPWYTNGEIEIQIKGDMDIPEGFHRGRKTVSEKTRKKMSDNNGMHKLTEEQKKKRSKKISDTINARTDEQKQAYASSISIARTGKGVGNIPWNRGKSGCQTAWNKGLRCALEKHKFSDSYSIYNLLNISDDTIRAYVSILKADGFPYVTDEHIEEYNKLLLIPPTSYKSKIGIDLILYFHPSIWDCHRGTKVSPKEAWNDEILLERVIRNRIKFLKNIPTKQQIVSGLTISGIAPRISLFNPLLAKYLIVKYLSEFDTIFDPCSGYSGRLLGASSLGKKYIGQDINPITIRESRCLIDRLDLKDASVSVENSLTVMGEYDCLFTCPPYGKKENWNQPIQELSCDEWIDACLQQYKCKKYLFVVDKTEKYQDKIVEKINTHSHLGDSEEQVILIEKQ